MSFRLRLFMTFLLAVLVPLVAFTLFIRKEMSLRLSTQYERRVVSLLKVIEEDLDQQNDRIASSLAIVRKAVLGSNEFRKAAVDDDRGERRFLLDYAATVMKLAGLSMLQIQDASGRIISSGHFRNEYDRLEPQLPKLLASISGKSALIVARAPDKPFLALAQVDSVELGRKKFTIVGGKEVERSFLLRLARGREVDLELDYPGGAISTRESYKEGEAGGMHVSGSIVRELAIPFVDTRLGELTVATFRVLHPLDELEKLRSGINRLFLMIIAGGFVFAFVLSGWLASRISKPLIELAGKTSRIDLDKLDMNFETSRKDEIGALSRLLGSMTKRLRSSAALLRDAERRATLGEMARQVNHDIKNGLVPIRNVFRHLIEQAGNAPEKLADIIKERQSTLDSSINYLENLASNYARISYKSERLPCKVNEIVMRVAKDARKPNEFDLEVNLEGNPIVSADPLALRRILENLVSNAIDSLKGKDGKIKIATEIISGREEHRQVRIIISDTGVGLTETEKAKVFDDFYTTKENGIGLGLSIVRRLVMDLEGSIDVESVKEKGTKFIVCLPEAGEDSRS